MKLVKITPTQLRHIATMADNVEAAAGGQDEDYEHDMNLAVKAIDKFLNNNGYTRAFADEQKQTGKKRAN